MNLLTYDYHSAFEPAVNHHAPLYPLEEPNEYSVDNELNIVSIHNARTDENRFKTLNNRGIKSKINCGKLRLRLMTFHVITGLHDQILS